MKILTSDIEIIKYGIAIKYTMQYIVTWAGDRPEVRWFNCEMGYAISTSDVYNRCALHMAQLTEEEIDDLAAYLLTAYKDHKVSVTDFDVEDYPEYGSMVHHGPSAG